MRTILHLAAVLLATAALAWAAPGRTGVPAPGRDGQDSTREAPETQVAPEAPEAGTRTVLITGANRGLGFEFARQMDEAGYSVIGTARKPDEAVALKALGVRVMQLDVADGASVTRLAGALEDEALDILINNAGISGRGGSIESLDLEAVQRVLDVNTLGPMRVTQALLPNLRRGERKLVVGSITSGLGSIEGNTRGGYYGYRESKAALNMFTRTLAAELRPAGFTCIVMSPGWVRTDMGGPQAPLGPEQSIGGMLTVMDRLKASDTGSFFGHDGERVAW